MISRDGSVAFQAHDHAHCVAAGLARAEARCAELRQRLTPVRARVLSLLLAAHRPLRAYDLLSTLAAEGLGAQPPVVYRALDFLMGCGLVHKVQSLNAFVACDHPGHERDSALLICTGCAQVAELIDAVALAGVIQAASANGFKPQTMTIEIAGLCPHCRGGGA